METRIASLTSVAASTWRPSQRPERFAGRREAQLARAVGLTQFGVNHLTLEPGSMSSLRHWHAEEDEFVLVLSGELTLIDENGARTLASGDCAGFRAGDPNAHHLENRSAAPASFVAVGTRHRGRETIHYPDDPLGVVSVIRGSDGERTGP